MIKKILLAVLSLSALFFAGCGGSYSSSTAKEYDKSKSLSTYILHRVVKIDSECEDGSGWGSGVIVESNSYSSYILTARHVVDGGCEYTVKLAREEDPEPLKASVVSLGKDDGWDWAVIKVEKDLKVDTNFNSNPYIGMELTCGGYPLHRWREDGGMVLNLDISHGYLTSMSFSKAYAKVDFPVFFGYSGSGCFDDFGRITTITSGMFTVMGAPVRGEAYSVLAKNVEPLRMMWPDRFKNGKTRKPVP